MRRMNDNFASLKIGGAANPCQKAVLSGFFSGILQGGLAGSFGGPVGATLGATFGSIGGALYAVATKC